MKKFSILCPTQLSQTRSQYILEAIESVRSQTYPNWELIIKADKIIADLSILQGQDLKNISVILNKDNGITDAMNQMLRFATGDIFMWMNDDDKLLPHTMQTIIDNIGHYEWGFGRMETNKGIRGEDSDLSLMKQANYVSQPTVFWTQKAYEEIGEMSNEQDLVCDYDYWVRLMRRYHHAFIKEPIAWYRFHEDQITSKMSREQVRQAEIVRSKV